MTNTTKKYTKDDISDYRNKITDEQVAQLLKHCHKHQINPEICAWYDDLDDLYEDYNLHCGYDEVDAAEMMGEHQEMFCRFKDGKIVKLVC